MSILDNDYMDQLDKTFLLGNFLPESLDVESWQKPMLMTIVRACGYYRSTDFYKALRKQVIGPEFIMKYHQAVDLDSFGPDARSGNPADVTAHQQALDAFCRAIKIKEQPMDPYGFSAMCSLMAKIGSESYIRKTVLLNDSPDYKLALTVFWCASDRFGTPRFEISLNEWIDENWSTTARFTLYGISHFPQL